MKRWSCIPPCELRMRLLAENVTVFPGCTPHHAHPQKRIMEVRFNSYIFQHCPVELTCCIICWCPTLVAHWNHLGGGNFYEVTMPGPDPDHFKSKAPGSNVQPELRTTELELSTSREAVIISECLFKKKKKNLRKSQISKIFLEQRSPELSKILSNMDLGISGAYFQ